MYPKRTPRPPRLVRWLLSFGLLVGPRLSATAFDPRAACRFGLDHGVEDGVGRASGALRKGLAEFTAVELDVADGRAAQSESPRPDDEPEARPLTAGELELARRVFGNAIEYERVRIYRRKWSRLMPGSRIISPDGNLYFPRGSEYYRADFSEVPLSHFARWMFVHELAHVYQNHQGVDVPRRRLAEGGRYRYELKPGKDLNDYNVEQQANLIADYARDCLELHPDSRPYCRDRYRPALDRFFEDPGYLRPAEKRRGPRVRLFGLFR